ncbi:hypothetical protein AAFF_G00068940 [Aldrovandia affinis]|uniref:Uncharacterized protein n=1 Tax=Aldrovandia affinis TaxID=143900 RepID=A0AAD7RZE4_9TELE|nr:hypothetical protein AAFF_G00068940 [Aldrovandia affinis]
MAVTFRQPTQALAAQPGEHASCLWTGDGAVLQVNMFSWGAGIRISRRGPRADKSTPGREIWAVTRAAVVSRSTMPRRRRLAVGPPPTSPSAVAKSERGLTVSPGGVRGGLTTCGGDPCLLSVTQAWLQEGGFCFGPGLLVQADGK